MFKSIKAWLVGTLDKNRPVKNILCNHKTGSAEASCETAIRSYASSVDICSATGSSINGLTCEEAAKRLELYGDNKQPDLETVTWKQIAVDSVFNFYNVLLVILAVISVVIPDRDWSLFVVIMIVVPLSAFINFWQELRSNRARANQAETLSNVYVRRQDAIGDSKAVEVDRKNVLYGDILFLSPGDVVTADCIVLESTNLSLNQSSLTGEGEPQNKIYGGQCDKKGVRTTIFDLQNVLFSGTNVISGNGLAIVFSTGTDSFISTIMQKLNGRSPLNSFQKGVRKTCLFLVVFMIISFLIIMVLKGTKTAHWQQAIVFALSTAATLVPEMLPAVVTANLSRGAFVLRKNGVVVNHMDAIHSLGSISVLCSDKTGTLTKDEIKLCHCLDPMGQKSFEVFNLAFANASNQSGTKNAIDAAIVNHAMSGEKTVKIGEPIGKIPFNFETRRSSCIIRTTPGALSLICKGAFEELMALCSNIRVGAVVHDLNEQQMMDLTRRVEDFNGQSYRVVLVASRDISDADVEEGSPSFHGLDEKMTIEGFLTFLDPLKEDAEDSVTRLQKLGVDVRILTGDNLGVALSAARGLGLTQELTEEVPLAISGLELADLTDRKEWTDTVKQCKIFAKLTPAQKGQVVETLQAQGEVVGMIGDGINDSIALNAADVGISVNTGSSVAKHSADLILTEKELSKVVDAVMIGRKTHGNIMKYMKLILAANFGNIMSVVVASIWLPFDPISPAQMVLQNLLYDLSQITIPFDNVDPEYLALPHQLSTLDLMRFILLIGPIICTIDIGTFLLNVYHFGLGTSSDILRVERFQCHWFVQGILSQTLVIYVTRTSKIPFCQGHPSVAIVVSTVFTSMLGLAIPYVPPFAKALKLVRPGGDFIGILVACLVLYTIVLQLAKMLYIKVWKRWL